MTTQGFIISPGQGPVVTYAPGRSTVLKLLCAATGGSIMLFEDTVPAGTASTLHLHRDSDEVAYVLRGEVTFKVGDDIMIGSAGACAFMPRSVPHAWKCTGSTPAQLLFLYTPAKAGGLIEEQQRTGGKFSTMTKPELEEMLARHGWTLLGPSPL